MNETAARGCKWESNCRTGRHLQLSKVRGLGCSVQAPSWCRPHTRSGGGHGGAAAETQQNLLAVLQGAPVAHPLQGALGLGQKAHPVTGRG